MTALRSPVRLAQLFGGELATQLPMAAAITFRMVTFYLPPLWGWPPYHWLQTHAYL